MAYTFRVIPTNLNSTEKIQFGHSQKLDPAKITCYTVYVYLHVIQACNNNNNVMLWLHLFPVQNAVKFQLTLLPVQLSLPFSLNENDGGITILVDLVLGELPFQVFVTLFSDEGGTAIGMLPQEINRTHS